MMGDGVAEFGMLVADPNHRGKGIGSALVDRVSARDGLRVLDACCRLAV
jgi:GNAT superfamily N-acetyltransferase